jgi:hypothetical protein
MTSSWLVASQSTCPRASGADWPPLRSPYQETMWLRFSQASTYWTVRLLPAPVVPNVRARTALPVRGSNSLRRAGRPLW